MVNDNYNTIMSRFKFLKYQGFTLIETALSLAAVGGILFSVHQQELNREQVSEAIRLSSASQEAIQQYYQIHGVLPTSNSQAHIPESERFKNSIISELKINDFGDIVLTFTKSKQSALLEDKTLILEPRVNNGIISWNCNGGSLEDKYKPSDCLQPNVNYSKATKPDDSEQKIQTKDSHPLLPEADMDFVDNENLI